MKKLLFEYRPKLLVTTLLAIGVLFQNSRTQSLAQTAPASAPAKAANPSLYPFGHDEPENQSVDVRKLVELTQWVKQSPSPILSVLISRNGKVVYELYTSSLDPEAPHYLMSITKSFLSALAGVAIDRKLIPSAQTPMSQLLPAAWFPNEAAVQKFRGVTLRQVLGMSALDAPVAPHQNTPEAIARNTDFLASSNRTQFALGQNLLKTPGKDFLYTDITCSLASGAVEVAAKESLSDFANHTLFYAMEFKSQEWMHQDKAGIDLGAYGLRLRPIDMQKFGILFLNGGNWDGKQLISRNWVQTSFTPWISSEPSIKTPNYGWYWWQMNFGGAWTAHVANGWKGQRIAVFTAQGLVVSMTAIIEDNSEDKVFDQLVRNYIIPAIRPRGDPGLNTASTLAPLKKQLATEIKTVLDGPSRIKPGTEPRMIPTIAPKGSHRPFNGP